MIKNNKFYLSKSGYKLYNLCPKKFKFQYIDKLEKPESDYKEVAEFGTMIHENIEDIKDNLIIDDENNIAKFDKKYVRNKTVKVNKKNYALNETEHMKNFLELTNRLLKQSGKPKYSIPEETEGHYFNDKLRIHGYIDAVYKNYEDDGIIIVDWKTGKKKKEKQCKEEMLFYALCWNYEHPENPVKYIAMYFTGCNYLFFEEVKQEDLEDLAKEIITVHKMIDIGCFFKTRYKWPCRFCEWEDKECEGK